MFLFENETGNRKICMWKEEDSCNDTEYKEVDLCISAGDINWHIGTIGIEVKLNPWHASNYAMICMRYSKKKFK